MRPGKLDANRVRPLLEAQGVHPRVLKELKAGTPVELPDGSTLDPADYVAASTQRKLAILSDMRGAMGGPSGAAEMLAQGANLLVHESTNACTQSDLQKGLNPKEVRLGTCLMRREGRCPRPGPAGGDLREAARPLDAADGRRLREPRRRAAPRADPLLAAVRRRRQALCARAGPPAPAYTSGASACLLTRHLPNADEGVPLARSVAL